MSVKKIIMLGLAGMSISAYATPDLILTNCTKINNDEKIPNPSTSIINGGACSTKLGAAGTTINDCQPHKVPGALVYTACLGKQKDCQADVYMTPNCNANNAKPIARVIFDTTGDGVKTVTIFDPAYSLSHSKFNITINGNIIRK